MDYELGIDTKKATYGNVEFDTEVPVIEQPKVTRQVSAFHHHEARKLEVKPKGYYEKKRAKRKISDASKRRNRK